MTRTFTGQIEGLEVDSAFVVITSAGRRPHVDKAYRDVFRVVRREESRIHAESTLMNIKEQARLPLLETYTHRADAPLSRVEPRRYACLDIRTS